MRLGSKKILVIIGVIIMAVVIIIVAAAIFLCVARVLTPEDTYIKNEKGQIVEHGKPATPPPTESIIQEQVKAQADQIYALAVSQKQDLTAGPCLSPDLMPEIATPADKWVLDIAHNPRTAIDDKAENQCAAYREGKAGHFIELDPQGNLIRMK